MYAGTVDVTKHVDEISLSEIKQLPFINDSTIELSKLGLKNRLWNYVHGFDKSTVLNKNKVYSFTYKTKRVDELNDEIYYYICIKFFKLYF